MKKNTRKNKTNQTLNMPKKAYYTLKELFAINKHFNAEITVRVRHTNVIEDGRVAEIGAVPGGKGRPQKVYALTPVTKTLLEKVRADGISLVDNAEKLINIINVAPNTSPTTPVVSLVGSKSVATS
jgi:hypothetical protein